MPTQLDDAMRAVMEPYHLDQTLDEIQPNWKWDYLCRFEPTLNCQETNLELPLDLQADLTGHVSKAYRLPSNAIPGAVLTPDGVWHDQFDFGWRLMNDSDSNADADREWRNYFRGVINRHGDCWVLETWAHS